jgi:hypothetical protein
LALVFILLGAQYAAAQTISHNQNGEKIVLYTDGSWRYFDENDPSDIALLEETNKTSKIKKAKTKKSKKSKNNKVAKVKSPKVKNEKVKEDKSNKAYTNQSKPKKSKKDKSYAKAKPKKKSDKINYTSITSGQNYKRIINKEILSIRSKQNIAFEKERIANFASQKYDKELSIAKKRKQDKNAINTIAAKRKEAKLRLKLARSQNKVLLKQRRAYESILKKDPSLYAKSYTKLANKYNKDFESVPIINEEQMVVSEASKKSKANRKPSKVRKPKKGKNADSQKRENAKNNSLDEYVDRDTYRTQAYQVSYPSKKPDVTKASIPNCNIVFEGKDSFSGKRRIDLGRSPFFSFTSDKMRSYFEEGDMIECEAYMSAVAGGYKFICLEVTVASETAQRSYGSIEKQGLLSIKLVDGTTVNLYNNKTDYGFLDPLKKKVLYKAQYLIPNEHVKTLSKVDVDMVRLVWSTGYEDYTIYETDFLINQLNCLDK